METLSDLVRRQRLQLTTLLDTHQAELEVVIGVKHAVVSFGGERGERARLPAIAEQSHRGTPSQKGQRVSLDGLDDAMESTMMVESGRQETPGVESSTGSLQWRSLASLESSPSGSVPERVNPVPTEQSCFKSGIEPSASPSETQPWTKFPLRSYVDSAAGVLVLLSSLSQLLELELKGRSAAVALGMEDGADFTPYLHWFQYSDSIFDILFLIEWIILVADERREYFRSISNAFDSFLVAVGLVNLYFNATVVRSTQTSERSIEWHVLQAVTALRAVRMLRAFRLCRGIRLLLRACHAFLPSLCWAMVLLTVFMSAGSLVMGTLLQPFINSSADFDDRVWIWYHYGTAYRSFYTVYEITFAGNWPTNTRPVLNKVSHAFSLFFLTYVTVIVFAVIRVITAVFLKDTLDAAHNDAEHLVAEALRKKAEYVEKLENVFKQIDDSGQGMITEERLNQILEDPKVAIYFQTLDLDVHEGTALFHILDNGDGEVTLDEFINGILRCRGPARAIDQVAMRAELKHLDLKVARLTKTLKDSGLLKKTNSVRNLDARRGEHMKVFRMAEPVNMFSRLISQ